MASELQSHLCEHCECSRLASLLDRLAESEYGNHLGACILIDIKTALVPPKIFARVFDLFDLSAADPVKEFGLAVEKMEGKDQDHSWPKRIQKQDDHDPRSYARVMEIGTFIRHCLPPGSLMDSASVRRTRLTRFGVRDSLPVGRLELPFRGGGRGTVWVLPQVDLIKIREEHKDDPGTGARNALGLPIQNGVGPEGKPDFVAVIYPESAVLQSTQPTTLDATWTTAPCYFLPDMSNGGWGRTHNCHGSGPTCRERVHGPLEILEGEYRGIDLGVARGLDTTLWQKILDDAESRLEAISSRGTSHGQ